MKRALIIGLLALAILKPAAADEFYENLGAELNRQLDLYQKTQSNPLSELQVETLRRVFSRLGQELDVYTLFYLSPRAETYISTKDVRLDPKEIKLLPGFSGYYSAISSDGGFPGYLKRVDFDGARFFLDRYEGRSMHYILPGLDGDLSDLKQIVGETGQFHYEAYLQIVGAATASLRSKEEFGGLFEIHLSADFGGDITLVFYLDYDEYSRLVAGFSDERCKTAALTSEEQRLVNWGVLNVAEVNELRAIRLAGAELEQNTYLKDDIAGFTGNMLMWMENQAFCWAEATTHGLLVDRLHREGLVKYFEFVGHAARFMQDMPPGHGAALIRSRRTDELFVIDSWHEAGGEPGYVLHASDWFRGSKRNISADCN